MRRPFWYRVLISLWAVWFSTALIEPAGFFACAMHSGMAPVMAAPVPAAPTGAASPHGHAPADHAPADHAAADHFAAGHPAAHAATPTDQATAETAQPGHDGHSCCTCLGQCSTLTAAVVPTVDVTIEERLARQARGAAVIVISRIPIRPAHGLPFANGPPAAVRT